MTGLLIVFGPVALAGLILVGGVVWHWTRLPRPEYDPPQVVAVARACPHFLDWEADVDWFQPVRPEDMWEQS